MSRVLLLERREVEGRLELDPLIDALGAAMAELSAGRVSMPPRVAARVEAQEGWLGVMPVFLPSAKMLCAKLVGVFPGAAVAGLPTHRALIAAFDPETGAPVALMDGEAVTTLRTAAGSALATRLLAPPGAGVLSILGTGVQARAHTRAVPRVRTIRELLVWGRRAEAAAALAAEAAGELGVPARAVSLEEATRRAEILCAATSAAEPVVHGRWLSPGAHVNSVGFNPEGRELDEEAVRRASLFVESRDSALAPPPAGANDLTWLVRDGRIGPDHVRAEIGEVVAGTAAGRRGPEEITLYKSVGVAVQDAAAARLVLDAARRDGAGRLVEL